MVTLRDGRPAGVAPGRVHLGLGLFIVRLVAEFHGGHASAHNLSSGGGARFAVEVPIAPQNP
jgi:signal transduction histidine kinase